MQDEANESTHFRTIRGWSSAFRSRAFNTPFFSCHPVSRVAKFVGVIRPYWKLTTSGRAIVCVCASRVLYVARESTRAWHRHLRREGWHPFVCSSRFLNSIVLVVWRTLIRSRRAPFFFTVCGGETMNIFVILSTIKSAYVIPVVDRDNRTWIQSTVDSSLIHLRIIQSSVTIIIGKKKTGSNSWNCDNYRCRVTQFTMIKRNEEIW